MFDRCQFEQDIKELTNPAEIYRRSEALSSQRLKGNVTVVEYEECMDLVKNRLRHLEAIKRSVS